MIAIANASLTWRVASWKRVAPTKLGALALLALPALFLLPLDQVPLFPDQRAGTQAIMWLGAFGLVGVFGRDVGKPVPSWSWLFQKGIPLAEHALTTWIADFTLGTAFITWWAIGWNLVMRSNFSDVLALWIGAVLTFVIGLSLVFLLNSALGKGSVELWMGFAFIALLDPLVNSLPVTARVAIRSIVPPLSAVHGIVTDIRNAAWGSALGNLLHPVIYITVCIGVGAYAISRWKPRRSD
jgi:hypothetical protein